jgi:hypothetical protein
LYSKAPPIKTAPRYRPRTSKVETIIYTQLLSNFPFCNLKQYSSETKQTIKGATDQLHHNGALPPQNPHQLRKLDRDSPIHHHVDLRKYEFFDNQTTQTTPKANITPGEHNTTDPATAQTPRRRRPDLSTFFSALSEITPAPDHRPHAVPVPGDVSAAFYSLAEALEMMRREADSAPADAQQEGTETAPSDTGRDLLTTMIQSLLAQADTPPREVEGVNEEFCDSKHFPFGLTWESFF